MLLVYSFILQVAAWATTASSRLLSYSFIARLTVILLVATWATTSSRLLICSFMAGLTFTLQIATWAARSPLLD
jgi:hypothetical protein